MGNLLRFPPGDRFVRRFPHFIETGHGDESTSFRLMVAYPFETLTTIEIHPPTAELARKRFGHDPRVTVIEGPSDEMLPELVAARGSQPTFFWLDAHFPGGDHQAYRGESREDYDKRLPLEAELAAILCLRPDGDYFIAIDDLRFYADMNWGDKVLADYLEPPWCLPKTGLGFLDAFRKTHRVEIVLDDSGYALIGPKDGPFLEFRG